MTTEEKAKAYDKAVEIISDYYQKNKYSSLSCASNDREVLERAFPQIIESEDERIRKEIVKFFKHYWEDGVWKPIPDVRKWINWLEKKGEQNPVPKFKIGDTMRTLQEAKDGWTDGMPFVVSIDSEYYNCNSEKIAIKDQDEYEYPPMNRRQNPADKVEPKSKAGDWVVCNNGSHPIFQVIERSWPNAKYRDIKGTEIFLNVKTLDKQYHLWTIQDAKAGDVLEFDFGIGIFKEHADKYNAYCYCYYNDEDGLVVNNYELLDKYQATPATKEQRELLFQKMEEAGYTFDFEKKELWHNIRTHNEQKPAWSEEDIATISRVISIVKWAAYSDHSHPILNDKGATELVDRLKSLKDRVQPQNTWKPSEEQMQALSNAGNSFRPFEESHKVLWSLYNDLKKLREE